MKIDEKTDWAEVKGLFIEAYRQVALKRMLKKLDAMRTRTPWIKRSLPVPPGAGTTVPPLRRAVRPKP